MRKDIGKIVLSAVGALLVFIVIAVIFGDSKESDKNDTIDLKSAETVTQAVTQEAKKENAKVLMDNDYVTVTYEDVRSDIDGMGYMVLNAVNKTDKEIWVYPDNVSINDAMAGGLGSANILGNKSERFSFVFGFEKVGITSINDIKNIEFTIMVKDGDFNDITSGKAALQF